jgi:hypothetical protein
MSDVTPLNHPAKRTPRSAIGDVHLALCVLRAHFTCALTTMDSCTSMDGDETAQRALLLLRETINRFDDQVDELDRASLLLPREEVFHG